MFLPNLIIAGPPKTGTTSLFDWLAQHPDVCPSIKKETGFFSDHISKGNRDCNFHEHGILAYENLFSTCKNPKIILEATPDYIYSETALNQLPGISSDPHIFLIHRDSSDRLLSEYKFHRFKTKRFKGSLKEYLAQERVQSRINTNSFYKKWLETPAKVSILLFDDLKENPRELLRVICRRVDIAEDFFDDFSFDTKNESVALKNTSLHSFSYKVSQFIPAPLKRILTPIYFKINAQKIPGLSESDIETLDEMKLFFQDEKISFEKLAKPYILSSK